MSNTVTTQLASIYLFWWPQQCSYLWSCTYGRRSASYDLAVMRLDCEYWWEVRGSAPASCALCDRPRSHTLFHCVMERLLAAHTGSGGVDCQRGWIGSSVRVFCTVFHRSTITQRPPSPPRFSVRCDIWYSFYQSLAVSLCIPCMIPSLFLLWHIALRLCNKSNKRIYHYYFF